jgi:hypothetical protein
MYLSIEGKDMNNDVTIHFFPLLIGRLHGYTVITGREFPNQCLPTFDWFVYITFNQGDKITNFTNM